MNLDLIPRIKHTKSDNFFLLSGPCAIENEEMALRIAEKVVGITDKLEIGIGTELGTIWQITPHNKLALTGSILKLIDTKNTYHSQVALSWNWSFKTNWSLRSNINYKSWITNDTQAKLTLYHYF